MLDLTGSLETLFDQMPFAVVLKDPARDHAYCYWNKAAEKAAGFTAAEVLGKTDFDLMSHEAAQVLRDMDLQCARQEAPVIIDRLMVASPRVSEIWMRIWKKKLKLPSGQPVILVVAHDITEKVRAEVAAVTTENLLLKEREKLAHASRLSALGELAAGIAHELNTPLSLISLHCEVAQDLLVPGAPEQLHHHLEKIQQTVQRTVTILQTMRGLAKKNVEGPSQWISLRALLEELRVLAGYRFKQENMEFRIEQVPEQVHLDAHGVQLSQVFLNLLTNSLEAVSGDSKWIQVSWKNPDHDPYCEIHFADSGRGIRPEVSDRLFETFFTTKEGQKGTGLGLAISREILRGYGGDLRYHPTAEQTTFVLHWPRSRFRAGPPTI